MLSRLSRTTRWRAGWCIALAYLFCVLAPSLSFAFADGARQAPCIVEDHGPAMQVDETTPDQHILHGHHAHDGFRHVSGGMMMADKDKAAPAKDPHKAADRRCCGLVSLSAIPAGEIVIVQPPTLTSRLAAESHRDIADKTPPRLYRPPIS